MMKSNHPFNIELIKGGDTPAYGINKFINPRDAKFSPNLYRWATYGNKHLTSVFLCPETGYYYIGLRQANGIFVGAKLMRVFCVGNAAETFSVSTSLSKTWHDVSKWFWEKYMEVGKGIYELPEWKKSEGSGK